MLEQRKGALLRPLFRPMRALAALLFCILSAPLAAFAAESGQPAFAAATLAIHPSPDGSAKPIGKLLVAAPLVVLGPAENGWLPVEVRGWTQAGAERVLQAAPGLRVTRAALGASGLDALGFGETRTDPETGLDWTRATLTGWIAADAPLTRDLDTLWTRAEALFATRCTACHVRRVPARYTANQWTSYLKVMGPRTGLPKDDQALIQVFLQFRSADAAALAAALAAD